MSTMDFLRSTTTTVTDREADGDHRTHVTHLARFGVDLGSVADQRAAHSRTVSFVPSWLEAEWRDGKLTRVLLSGPQRLKSGGRSDKLSRHREWRVYGYRTETLDRSELPEPVAERLATYERAIAGQSHGSTSL